MIGRIEQQAADVAARDNEGISCDGQDVEGVMEEGEGADVMCELMSRPRPAGGGGGGGGGFPFSPKPLPHPCPLIDSVDFLRFFNSPPPPHLSPHLSPLPDYINDGVYGSFNCILFDHQVGHPYPLTLASLPPTSSSESKSKCISRQPGPPTPPNISLPIDLSVRLGYTETEKASIWGPTCDSIDCVREDG